MNALEGIGAVVIGRNEGARLTRCLATARSVPTVYVDSGSSDNSPEAARQAGAQAVVDLSPEKPFSAARARNEGFAALRALTPDLQFVQFIDGDCELAEGWIEAGVRALQAQNGVAAVCGRLWERHPEHSVYNRLSAIEWDRPVGETDACAGVAMFRADAFEQAKGFREDMIAGEEPELCVRLRLAGWRIVRLPDPMASHDAAMRHFSQWWRRAVRAGHAYAEGAHLHGRGPLKHWVRETRSIWVWGALLPAMIFAGTLLHSYAALLLLGVYPVQFFRTYRGVRRLGLPRADSAAYSISCVLAKFAGALGAAIFHVRRLLGMRRQIIQGLVEKRC